MVEAIRLKVGRWGKAVRREMGLTAVTDASDVASKSEEEFIDCGEFLWCPDI